MNLPKEKPASGASQPPTWIHSVVQRSGKQGSHDIVEDWGWRELVKGFKRRLEGVP